MSQIFESLKALISPEMISKASSYLGEKDSKVSSAAASIVPGILGSIMKKGDSSQVESVLEDAGRSNILADMSRIFSGNMTENQRSLSDRFIHSIMGTKANDFTSAVAADSGISNASANKLTTMVSAVIAGFLGNKIVNNNTCLNGVVGDLNREKHTFLGMVPSRVTNTLGLGSLVGADRAYATGISNNSNDRKPKKGNGWLMWLILAIVLLLLFFWWRSCKRNDNTVDRMADRTTEWVDTASNRVNRAADNIADNIRGDRETREIELPNGTKMTVYRNGAEEELVDYLKSDNYKNADNATLGKKWFGFDNIRFKFDSTTELMDGSHPQMDNIATILKYYDNTKVVIGGFADAKGTEAANDQVSKERADYIKSLLVQRGVSASRITTEGYGDDFAKHNASESDRARAEDRTIALRFTK